MARYIPHVGVDTEVRRAIQRLGNDLSTLQHDELGGLSDDDHLQYHNDTRGDARYFREDEHINSSAGAGDAGKPIILNASGVVDATMISAASIDHGGLSGLGDDDHTQYHNDARGDARYYTETELDAGQLDNRYFRENEHINSSAGAGDAGKPIVLDAAGHIDDSMINDADVDHGTIGGLGDDDHTQYLLADGTRNLSGNWTIDTGVKMTFSSNVIIEPTGTGTLQGNSGGNARGNYAVDLGLYRSAATQVASGDQSVVIGGYRLTAAASYSTVCGGNNNTINANSTSTTIVGGSGNSATYATTSFVGGGQGNVLLGTAALDASANTICGGIGNSITYSRRSTICGGYNCSITGDIAAQKSYCGIGSGFENQITGCVISYIGGGYQNSIGSDTSTIVAGNQNAIDSNSSCGFIGGGAFHDIATSTYSTIGGGYTCSITDSAYSTIGGGYQCAITAGSGYNYGRNTIAGGYQNSAQGAANTVGGGQSNTIVLAAGALGSAIGGGNTNSITNSGATISGGRENVGSGEGSTIPGGRENTASGTYSSCSGYQGDASRYGQVSHSSGRFSVDGDAQRFDVVMRVSTSDDTATELFLDGSSARLTIPEDTIWGYRVTLIAVDTGTIATVNMYSEEGVIYRASAGNATMGGTSAKTNVIVDFGWSYVIDADTSNQSLRINVQGNAAQNVQWVAHVEIIETKI